MSRTYRFTFGPWNISTGADPFGPPVRPDIAVATKLREYKKLGFDGIQLHDDDVVPADLSPDATRKGVAEFKKMLDGEGLFAEFIAPRLWEHPQTVDGGYTANSERAFELLQNLVHERGKALLLATHNPAIAEACDWVHEMRDGLIVASNSRGIRRLTK